MGLADRKDAMELGYRFGYRGRETWVGTADEDSPSRRRLGFDLGMGRRICGVDNHHFEIYDSPK